MSRSALLLAPLMLLAALLGGCDEDSTYRACGSDGDCESGESCATLSTAAGGETLSGRQCTRTCEVITDCPHREGSRPVCLALEEGESAYCYGACRSDEDCLDGARCLRFTFSTGQEIDACFPSSS